MNNFITSLVLPFCIISLIYSDTKKEISTDSLAVLIQSGNEKLLDEVIYEDPTENRTLGIMFNPIAPIMYKQGLRLRGGFSYFPKDSKNELSLNYIYRSESDNNDYRINVDALNRFYFDRKYRKGFHMIYGGRYTLYRESLNFFGYNIEDLVGYEPEYKVGSMLGISFGVGYRILNPDGFYWGASCYIGRHIIAKEEGDDNPYIEMEFFKIGYLFK